ncbi:hypothetical protein MK852_07565 [Shewanella benthica]|uniref:hypothetical protein n=1 Tax=Shewanella benthica TaxID=43661 RepID=UPI00187B0E8B|nr:hypothetical protein [Shewanella benthica]MBE7215018.1 hypothetical protein [Shewanella benthica]MCL1061990.1 hypothetical protein [Shewanella benthica]
MIIRERSKAAARTGFALQNAASRCESVTSSLRGRPTACEIAAKLLLERDFVTARTAGKRLRERALPYRTRQAAARA